MSNKIMKWKYAGTADIIFGEVKINSVPKIMLISIISFITLSIIIIFVFRSYIYDLIFNPHIELNNKVKNENEILCIELNVNEKFNAYDYIDNIRTLKYDDFMSNDADYTCNIIENVNTSKIGTYDIVYESSNRVRTQQTNVIVKVVDNYKPNIQLVENIINVSYTDKTLCEFDPNNYIKNMSDNYYDVNVDYCIYEEDTNVKTSIDDIRNLYFDVSALNVNYSDMTKEQLNDQKQYLSDIIAKYNQISNTAKKQYIIEYTVTEDSDNKLSDQAELLLVIDLDDSIKTTIETAVNNWETAASKYKQTYITNTTNENTETTNVIDSNHILAPGQNLDW